MFLNNNYHKNIIVSITLVFTLLFYSIVYATGVLDTSFDITSEEKSFMLKRDALTQNHLLACHKELFPDGFDKNIHKLPKIAFCFSGGGNRALITSLGFMQGAEKIGLLDCASYASFLSGSSWFYLSFLLKNMSNTMGLQEYRDFLQSRLEKPFKKNARKFLKEIQDVKKIRGSAAISDGFGRIVYTYLLGDTVPEHASFKDIRDHLGTSGENMPFPLFTAIVKNTTPYRWLEVNPFSTGSNELGGYIPTNYFGSIFSQGTCSKIYPELSLASFMGIFGSAYCLNTSEITGAIKTKFLPSSLQKDFALTEEKPSRLQSYLNVGVQLLPNPIEAHSKFNNFFHKTTLDPVKSSHMIVADAGIDFNLPTPPLLKKERHVDLIIMCDASYKKASLPNNSKHLIKAQKYAHDHGIPFPTLTNPVEIAPNILVFEDQDPKIPTVIYFRSSATTSTLKFNYTAHEFNNICDETQDRLIAAQDKIFEAIKRKTRLLNSLAVA